jgi:hypothetical protein
MGLGSEVHEGVDLEPLHGLADRVLVAYILAYERIARIALQTLEILRVPGIGERIQHHHATLPSASEPMTDEV